jgi:hypothetical protein
MRSTIRRKLNNKTRKDTWKKFCKIMAVPIIHMDPKFVLLHTQEEETRIESAVVKSFRSVAEYT